MYGLIDDDAAALQSEDDEFYGNDELEHLATESSTEITSDDEEVQETEPLDAAEVQCRVSRACQRTSSNTDDPSTSASHAGLISPESDPMFIDISRKLSAGCSCSENCFSQFTASEVFSFHLSLCEMNKIEKEMLILGKLHVFSRTIDSTEHARQVKLGKRKRVTCDYAFDHRHVCKSGFLLLHSIGTKQLKNLQKHLRENGPVPREHGLTSRVPVTTYPYEVVSDAVYFIRNHATIYGIPQPAARSGRAETPPIYLPASQNYKIVHAKYVEACQAKDPHFRFLQYKSFISVWKRCLPDIVFMTPRFDVCAKCELFRFQLRDAVHENDKVKVSKEFSEHVELAQQEREYYISLSKKSESEYSQNSETPPEFAHYTFDFAEQVFIPHHARQVGPLYFKVCRKIQLFGVCCDSNRKQINYLIDEDNSIGPNGKKTHGPNSVISMLDHYLTKHGLQESKCHFHCDNCVGQNKNNFVIGYLAWRVITGKHQDVTLSFMRVGHTRCLVDGHFGLIKKIYRQCDTDTLTQVAEVVERSSRNNVPQLFDWKWREWDVFIPKYFKRIPLITKHQHFRFSISSPTTVFVRENWDSAEKPVSILKPGVSLAKVKRARMPAIIHPAGLTQERKKYLYEQIRPFVTPEYQDTTCPCP